MRLYVSVQPLFVCAFLLGMLLITLNLRGKIDNFITVFIFIAALLSICISNKSVLNTQSVMETFHFTHVRVEGRISSVPDVSERRTTFYVNADNIYSDSGKSGENIKVYVIAKENYFKYGDEIVFNGYLTKTAETVYYLAKGAPLKANNVTVLRVNRGKFPFNIIANLKNNALEVSDKILSDEGKMLFKAIALGDKTGFSEEFSDKLTKAGISHIACVSGLHVSLVGMGVYMLLKRKKYLAFLLSVGSVVLFTVITGAAPSTVRAAIMFTVYIFSKVSMRQNDSFTTLSLSAMILIAINPYVIYDWGFVLSFLSVLGIEVFYNDLHNALKFLPGYFGESIAVTLSAQIMTFPAITIIFGRISAYSVLSNIVISAIFTTVLYLCIIFVFVSNIPGVNILFSSLCNLFLDAVCAIANLFCDMPYSYIGINSFNITEVVCYYALIVIYVFKKKMCDVLFYLAMALCAIVLCVNFYNKTLADKRYDVGENSYIVLSNETSFLVCNDDLKYVKDDILQWGREFDVDFIITVNNVNGLENELKALQKLVCAEKVYINEIYTTSDFLRFSERENIKVEEYPENRSIEDVIAFAAKDKDMQS
ncbi:MAG: ComEC/Rec2 family competence protein [Clostridia bacterium]